MCNECPPPSPEIKEAYETFEAQIKVFLEAIDRTYDVMTDWVLITAQTELGKHNDSHAVGWECPLGQAQWHTKGLMQDALDTIRAVEVKHFLNHD